MPELTLTIAIPTYNRCDFAIQNLSRLISEGFLNCGTHILISDNHSPDRTFPSLVALAGGRNNIQIFRQTENIGLIGNMLFLLEHAKTDYVLFCSDEDFINLDALKNLLEYLAINAPNFVSTSFFSDGMVQRNRQALLGPESIDDASTYISGLVFKRAIATKHIDFIRSKAGNHYVFIYPQRVLALLVFLYDGCCHSIRSVLAEHVFQCTSDCEDHEKFWLVESRMAQIRGMFKLFDEIRHDIPVDRLPLLCRWYSHRRKYVFYLMRTAFAAEADSRIYTSFKIGYWRYLIGFIISPVRILNKKLKSVIRGLLQK